MSDLIRKSTRFLQVEFVTSSNDKSFGPLVQHFVARGYKRRRDGQVWSAAAWKSPFRAHTQAVADLLRRSENNKRPSKRVTLANYLVTHFQKKVTVEESRPVVEHLP